MKYSEIYRAAAKKIEKPENWCQKAIALNFKTGKVCHPKHPQANQWCMIGAIEAISNGDEANNAIIYAGQKSDTGLGWFNDHASHENVLDRLLIYANLAEEEGM